jgi:hypothetical protein
MSNKIYLPSLSEDGWVNSSSKIADYLISHFRLSDYSQTYIYHENVSSLPYILQKTQGSIFNTVKETESILSTYFSRYFNNVVVDVSEIPNTEDPSKGQISIYLKFTDSDNKTYDLGKLLEVRDTTIERIINLDNAGAT